MHKQIKSNITKIVVSFLIMGIISYFLSFIVIYIPNIHLYNIYFDIKDRIIY